LLYTLVLSLATGLVFGITPAWRGSRTGLVEELKPGGRGSVGHGSGARLRSALVVAEIALSLVLLDGAGFMLRSLMLLARARPGFDPDNLVTLRLELPSRRYPSAERVRAFYDGAIENLRTLPGVHSAAISTSIPFRGWSFGMPFEIEGRPPVAAAARPYAHFVMVSGDYMPTLGIEMRRGRGLSAQDDAGSAPVAVVNAVFARRFLAGEEPLGKHVRVESILTGRRELGPPVNWRIVGVCGTVRASALADLDSDASPEIYVPFAQSASQAAYITLRTTSDRLNLGAAIRTAIQSEDRDLPVTDIRTMAQIRSESMRIPKILTGFIATFGVLALGLAAIGIYGLISYSVSQRTQELGVRAALGAQRRDVIALVMKQGGKLSLIGLGIGFAGSAALARVLRNMLYGVKPHDSATLAAVTLFLAVAAALATWLPARRAVRIDPSVALRSE
jgi:putative ABC transport system permease protein